MNEFTTTIGCKECVSRDCRGCNMFILYQALQRGVFTPVMSKAMSIDADALEEKLAEHKEEGDGNH